MPSPIGAINAYNTIARITNASATSQASSLTGGAGLSGGQSFGSLLENVMSSMAQKGREADAKTMQMAAGKADLTDVVTAVAETETAVETLVAVRDKVISAYEEIFRMPI